MINSGVSISGIGALYAVMSVIAFYLFAIDKQHALKGEERVAEKTLWFVSALYGWPGSLLAMELFRHKTQKLSFQILFVVAITLNVAINFAFYWLCNYY